MTNKVIRKNGKFASRKLGWRIKNFFNRHHSYGKNGRLAVFVILAIYITGFIGWSLDWTTPAIAEVNVEIPQKDNRNLSERLFNDLDTYGFNLKEKLNAIRLVGECENRSWNIDSKYINKPTKGCSNGSVDRGLFMINDCYHKEVSNACAYNYECALKEFVRIYRARGWQEWSCGKLLGLNN